MRSNPRRTALFFVLVNGYLLKIELMQSMILFVFRVFFIYHILPFSANLIEKNISAVIDLLWVAHGTRDLKVASSNLLQDWYTCTCMFSRKPVAATNNGNIIELFLMWNNPSPVVLKCTKFFWLKYFFRFHWEIFTLNNYSSAIEHWKGDIIMHDAN